MYIQDVKIVDLRASTYDRSRKYEDPSKIEFDEKRYLNYKDPSVPRCPFKFRWVRNTPRDIQDAQVRLQESLVTPKDDYWPDGTPPDQEGKYVFGDVVLMKQRLEDYIKRRSMEIRMSEAAPQAAMDNYDNLVRNEAAQYGIEDAVLTEEEKARFTAGRKVRR